MNEERLEDNWRIRKRIGKKESDGSFEDCKWTLQMTHVEVSRLFNRTVQHSPVG